MKPSSEASQWVCGFVTGTSAIIVFGILLESGMILSAVVGSTVISAVGIAIGAMMEGKP